MKGIFKPTLVNATNFCGSLIEGCYFKGILNDESFNCVFTKTTYFYNININGIIFGSLNAYANIIELKETHIPKEYETGDYDYKEAIETDADSDNETNDYEKDEKDAIYNYNINYDEKYKKYNYNINYNYN